MASKFVSARLLKYLLTCLPIRPNHSFKHYSNVRERRLLCYISLSIQIMFPCFPVLRFPVPRFQFSERCRCVLLSTIKFPFANIDPNRCRHRHRCAQLDGRTTTTSDYNQHPTPETTNECPLYAHISSRSTGSDCHYYRISSDNNIVVGFVIASLLFMGPSCWRVSNNSEESYSRTAIIIAVVVIIIIIIFTLGTPFPREPNKKAQLTQRERATAVHV